MRHALLVALAVAIASGAGAQRHEPRLLIGSGTVVDGRTLVRFGDPRWDGRTLVFRAGSQAITVPDGDATRELVACGTLLPAPLRGTLSAFEQVASTPDGVVAFTASLDSPDADVGVFRVDAGSLVTIAAHRTLGEYLLRIALDADGTVLFSTADGVYLRPRDAGESERIAELSSRLLRQPAFRGGIAAWITSEGVAYWSRTTGLRDVARLDAPSALAGAPFTSFARGDADVAPGVGVAWLADVGSVTAAFLWDSATGKTEVIARTGDLVDGEPIRRFDRRIEIGPDGAVYLDVTLGRRGRWLRWLRPGFEVVRTPSRWPTGSAGIASHEGLYARRGRRLRTVARVGDDLPGIGRVAAIGEVVARGGDVVFLAATEERWSIVRWRGGRTQKVIESGESVSGVGTVAFSSTTFDASGASVVLAADEGVVLLRGGSGRRVPTPDPDSGGVYVFDLRLVGSSVVMAATRGELGTTTGIYVARNDRVAPWVETGTPLPGSRATVTAIREVAIEGPGRAFVAVLDDDSIGLFVGGGRRLRRLSSNVAGVVVVPYELAFDGRNLVFSAGGAVHLATPAGTRPVVEPSETTRFGHVQFFDTDDWSLRSYALGAGDMVFATQLIGGTHRTAILARRLGSRPR